MLLYNSLIRGIICEKFQYDIQYTYFIDIEASTAFTEKLNRIQLYGVVLQLFTANFNISDFFLFFTSAREHHVQDQDN